MRAEDELYNNLMSVTDSGAIKGMDAREDGVYITYVPAAGADAVTKKLGSCFTIGCIYAQGGGNGYAYAHVTLNVKDASKVILGGHFTGNDDHLQFFNLIIQIDGKDVINLYGDKTAMINALKNIYDVSNASTFYIQFRTTSTNAYKFGVNSITIE